MTGQAKTSGFTSVLSVSHLRPTDGASIGRVFVVWRSTSLLHMMFTIKPSDKFCPIAIDYHGELSIRTFCSYSISIAALLEGLQQRVMYL
jgi:hypothetical protein